MATYVFSQFSISLIPWKGHSSKKQSTSRHLDCRNRNSLQSNAARGMQRALSAFRMVPYTLSFASMTTEYGRWKSHRGPSGGCARARFISEAVKGLHSSASKGG